MPRRYDNMREGGRFFYVWNTGFHDKTLFRSPVDYKHFVSRLEKGAAYIDECRVVGFSLLRNQYHLIVEEVTPGGVARFIHRLNISYATYFNHKYTQVGKVFAGPYKEVRLADDEQLMLQLAIIARLPESLGVSADTYKWSSLRAYTNSQHSWLHKQPVMAYFASDEPELLRLFVQSVAPS